MEYKRIQIGCYEPDIEWVFKMWAEKIINFKKKGLIIEIETKKEERWRIRPSGELNLKSKEMTEWGVKALYPITYVYEIVKI